MIVVAGSDEFPGGSISHPHVAADVVRHQAGLLACRRSKRIRF